MSWVQTVVRQVGLYPLWAKGVCEDLPLVREDRGGRSAGEPVVAPAAEPGSRLRSGEPLKASKWETDLKMSLPIVRTRKTAGRPPVG